MPAADIITPYQFELDMLAGATSGTPAELRAALAAVHELGPKVILVTSLVCEGTPVDAIDLVDSDPSGAWMVRTPRLDISVNGAGDAIAALFFVHWLRSRSSAEALRLAASSIYGLLRRTAEADSREILTVAAQDEFVAPSRVFDPVPL